MIKTQQKYVEFQNKIDYQLLLIVKLPYICRTSRFLVVVFMFSSNNKVRDSKRWNLMNVFNNKSQYQRDSVTDPIN